MQTSQNGIDLIKKFEGCRLTAYKVLSSEKYYTIGYGHYGVTDPTFTITQEQAEELLKQDLVKFETHVNNVNERYKYNFNQNEFDALVSFAYNLGTTNQLTLNGTRSKSVIADKMLLYVKSGGIKLEGLARRRRAERELFLTAVNNINIDYVVNDVIRGKYGNGDYRKEALTSAGYDYDTIQKEVNKRLAK